MKLWIQPVLFVLVLLLFTGTTLAEKEEGIETLEGAENIVVKIDRGRWQQVKISYDVTVTSGANVNVYFMRYNDYVNYKNSQGFNHIDHISKLDTRDAENLWWWSDTGPESTAATRYIVIDVVNRDTLVNSTVDYKIEWEAGTRFYGIPWYLCMSFIVVIVILAFAQSWMKKRKGGSVEEEPTKVNEDLEKTLVVDRDKGSSDTMSDGLQHEMYSRDHTPSPSPHDTPPLAPATASSEWVEESAAPTPTTAPVVAHVSTRPCPDCGNAMGPVAPGSSSLYCPMCGHQDGK